MSRNLTEESTTDDLIQPFQIDGAAVRGHVVRLGRAAVELLGSQAEVRGGKILGLGLDYTAVVGAIQHLCDDQSVVAAFVFEQPNMTELFGPPKPAERPESEL